jgi:HK97 family phage portal protein
MGVRSAVRQIVAKVAARALKYSGVPLRDPTLIRLLGGNPARAGIDVDEWTSLNFSAVWQAVNLLSSSVANLPLGVFGAKSDGWHPDTAHPAEYLLAVAPNEEQTPFLFHETLQAHCLLWGNAYAHIERAERDPASPPVSLWPILPNQIRPARSEADGRLIYVFSGRKPGEKNTVYESWEILHIPGLSYDGVTGYSVVGKARESISLGLATEAAGAGFFGKGMMLSGVLTHPGDLDPEARRNLRESWEDIHQGIDRSHRVAILDEGMKFEPIGIPPEDSQFLQTRQFQVIEVARWFNLPPHMLRDLSNASFANIEQQSIDFLVYSLSPWLSRWAQEYRRKLFAPRERAAYQVRHNVAALLKTDITTRYAAHQIGMNGGWLSVDEIREAEGLPRLPGDLGDRRLQPLNMATLGERTAVPPAVLADTLEVLRSMRPVDEQTSREMLLACMPQATDSLLSGLVRKLRTEGVIV